MLALIIVANPNSNSLSHAMASEAMRVLAGRDHRIAYHDLYAERFDPIQPTGEEGNVRSSDAPVEQHCSELARADLILVFHPNWGAASGHGLCGERCDSRVVSRRQHVHDQEAV